MKAVHFEFSLLQSRINNKINDRLFHVTRISALRGEKRGGGLSPSGHSRSAPRLPCLHSYLTPSQTSSADIKKQYFHNRIVQTFPDFQRPK